MALTNNIKEAVSSLISTKQRTLLALVGIVIGIASVIAMISVGQLAQIEAMRQFKEMGTNIMSIQMEYSTSPDASGFTLKEALETGRFCSSISETAPYSRDSDQLKYRGRQLEPEDRFGVTRSFFSVNKLALAKGRFISDLDRYAFYAVIGHEVAIAMRQLGITMPLGQKIKSGGHIFTIVGILARANDGGMRPRDLNSSIFIPVTTLRKIDPQQNISEILVRVSDGIGHSLAQRQVRTYFSNLKQPKTVQIRSAEQLLAHMKEQMEMFTLLLAAVGSISLIVGGVGVMNVMLVSVSERKREIGIRRALGAKRWDIQSQFLIESLLLSIVGGLIGIGFGTGTSWFFADYSQWQFTIFPSAIFLGFCVSSLIGIFFGFYPAFQASRLDPITALKSE